MVKKLLKVLFLSLGYSGLIFPVYYKARIYERFNEQMNDMQYVLTLSDAHNTTKELNFPQIITTKEFFYSLKRQKLQDDLLVVAEDVGSYEGPNSAIKRINSMRSFYFLSDAFIPKLGCFNPLLSLVAFAKKEGFDAVNSEHRFLRLIGMPCVGQIFNVEVEAVYSNAGLTTKAVAHEIAEALDESKQLSSVRQKEIARLASTSQRCKDLTNVENLWQRFKNSFEPKLIKMHDCLKKYDGTLYKYIMTHCNEIDQDVLVDCFLYPDIDLITIKALDELVHTYKRKIVVAAGGLHIKDLESSLEQMGYTLRKHCGKEYDWDGINMEDFLQAQSEKDLQKIFGKDFELVTEEIFNYFADL